MPGPVSRTRIHTRSPSQPASTVTVGALAGVLHGVVDQVEHAAVEHVRARRRLAGVLDIGGETHVGAAGERFELLNSDRHQFARVDRLQGKLCLGSRQEEQVLAQARVRRSVCPFTVSSKARSSSFSPSRAISATSMFVRMAARGVRSSCEAS